MKKTVRFILTDHGPQLRQLARYVAIVAAAIILAADATYRAGFALGSAVHAANDWLSGLASGRIDRQAAARAVVAWARATVDAAPRPAAVTAQDRPVVILRAQSAATVQAADRTAGIQRPSLESMTVRDLRQLARAAGHRQLARNGRRADLLRTLEQ